MLVTSGATSLLRLLKTQSKHPRVVAEIYTRLMYPRFVKLIDKGLIFARFDFRKCGVESGFVKVWLQVGSLMTCWHNSQKIHRCCFLDLHKLWVFWISTVARHKRLCCRILKVKNM